MAFLTLPSLPFNILITSRQLISGHHVNGLGGLLTSFAGTITALAGGGFPKAPTLSAAFNEITVCATIADSVALPLAKQGLRVCVTNSGAASANVFPQPLDNISGAGAGVAAAVAAAAVVMFICTKNGIWRKIVTT